MIILLDPSSQQNIMLPPVTHEKTLERLLSTACCQAKEETNLLIVLEILPFPRFLLLVCEIFLRKWF